MFIDRLFRLSEHFIVLIIFFLGIFLTDLFSQLNNEQILKKANAIYQRIDRISVDSTRQVPSMVRGVLARNINLENESQVQNVLQNSSEIFKINNQNDDFKTIRISKDKLGTTHLKLQQEYKGIPVWGSQLILHASSSGDLREINGRFKPNLNLNVRPAIPSERALEIALDDFGPAQYRWLNPEQEESIKEVYNDDSRTWEPAPKLMIAPVNGNFNDGEYRLVWKMTIAADGAKLGNWEYFIDAQNGKIINKFNAMPDVSASGTSNYNGTVSFEANYNATIHKFELYDAARNIKTYTANNTATYPGTMITNYSPVFNQSNAVDAHWGMKEVYDFWDEVFGRDSYNDNGGLIKNTVDYVWAGPDPNNAQSVGGGQFLFGAGDGNLFSSVSALDVMGHEFNHTIDDFEADLIYQGESGAIDESLADIMGTVIEFYATPSKANWHLGEDCYTPGTVGDALRYMDDPNAGGQPDTYLGAFWYDIVPPCHNGNDQCGVHYNSGVLNYAFYLMTAGGSGINDNGDAYNVTGIGIVKSRAIAYLAHSEYLFSSANYTNARDEFLNAADELFGVSSSEYETVSEAFGAVGIGVRYFAKNNFNAGIIKINGNTKPSGSDFFATPGDPQTLQAVEQYNSPYNYVWNTTGSIWKRQPEGGGISNISGATNISYTFTASLYTHNTTYIADLRKVLNITRYDQSIESGNTFNSANVQVIEGNSILAPSSQTVGGVTYHFYDWSDGVTANPRTISSPVSELTARYKALHHSNDISAFSNNGQRKFIQTELDGTIWLHQVYESMNHVWIEHSNDGGSTWILGNEGQSLDGDSDGAKNPCIAYFRYDTGEHNYIGVVWQEKYNSTYKIKGLVLLQNTGAYEVPGNYYGPIKTFYTESSEYYSAYDANPNLVMVDNFGPYLLTIEKKVTSGNYPAGLNYFVGHSEDPGRFGYVAQEGSISGTTANTTRAQLSLDKDLCAYHYISANLIYQQGSSTGTIYSRWLMLYHGEEWEYYEENDGLISSSSNNFSPSITSLPSQRYAACWINNQNLVYYCLGRDQLYYRDWFVRSSSINSTGDSDDGYVTYSWEGYMSNWTNKAFRFNDGIPQSSVSTLSTSGKYVQAANAIGTSSSYMRVSSFYPFSLPYSFATSGPLGPLSKNSSKEISGRGFMIRNGDATFSYLFSDLNVDGENIGFVETPDTLDFSKLENINNVLISEPFQINESSSIIFSEQMGFGDSLLAKEKLNEKDYINYTVELIDETTGKKVANVKDAKLSASNTCTENIKSYKLNPNGIGPKTVQAKIVVETNLVKENGPVDMGQYSSLPEKIQEKIKKRLETRPSNLVLIRSYKTESEAFAKSTLKELNLETVDIITEFSLEQNYPNPFNPVTMIRYNLPEDSRVSLVVYNVNGQKVRELVNGFKPAGSYTVTFDAKGLASGVYFYKVTAGKFNDVKRMLLIK